jgi:hypothetical protein
VAFGSSGVCGVKSRADYKRAFGIVGDIVRRWDPYALVANGFPPDEFDGEIGSVVAQIPRIKSQCDATDVLSRVFSAAFGPKGFGLEDCASAGNELFESLRVAGLLLVSTPAEPGDGAESR